MKRALLCALLAGCAGSPVGIKMLPNAKEVTVAGTAVVVGFDGATWAATYRDYVANNLYVPQADHLRRKAVFIQAIEQVSKCRVVDSSMDPGAATLHAMVKC